MKASEFYVFNADAGSGGGGRPPKPTRDQILALKTSGMQGMTVTMSQPSTTHVSDRTFWPTVHVSGHKPWRTRVAAHERLVEIYPSVVADHHTAISASQSVQKPIAFTDGLLTSPIFTKEDRQAAYAEKRRLGDTHVILNLSWNYLEPNLTYDVPGRDLSQDLPTFREYVEEALDQGFYVVVMLAGDGRSKPKNPDGSYPYNDPVGWTYGREWLLDNFQRIYASLADISPWIIWSAGYDGCIPEWGDHGEVDTWTLSARLVIGDSGYLMQHFSAGYCWWGGQEGNNFVTPGGLALDLATTCMPVPMNCPDVPPNNWANLNDEQKKPWTQVWQVAGRLTKGWTPQPDQVSTGDDLHPPYLLTNTSRGPQRHCVLEICTYDWVRGHVDLAGVNRRRRYLASAGVQLMG